MGTVAQGSWGHLHPPSGCWFKCMLLCFGSGFLVMPLGSLPHPAWEPQMKPLAPGLSLVQPRLQGQHSGTRQQGPGWSPWLLAAVGIPRVKQQAHALSSSLLCLLPKEEKSLFKINGEKSQHSGTCIPYRHQFVSHSLRFPSNSLLLWLG